MLVPVGGGGLLSGVATAIKSLKPDVKVIGVEPEVAADAQDSFRSGRVVEITAAQAWRTIADGVRTLHVSELTLEHIRRYVDDIITVSETELRAALRLIYSMPSWWPSLPVHYRSPHISHTAPNCRPPAT